MKEMLKARVMLKDSLESVVNELNFLKMVDQSERSSKFVANVKYAFQDSQNLYIVIDLLEGGDFRFHLLKEQMFQPECTQFFVACIALGLNACHKAKLIHRDLKPENLVFDKRGYVYLTDFGIAFDCRGGAENYDVSSGTVGYMAPEVMNKQNHTYSADYFAVGVIAFECITGKRPYRGRTADDIKNKMAKEVVKLEIEEGCDWDDYPPEAIDFVN